MKTFTEAACPGVWSQKVPNNRRREPWKCYSVRAVSRRRRREELVQPAIQGGAGGGTRAAGLREKRAHRGPREGISSQRREGKSLTHCLFYINIGNEDNCGTGREADRALSKPSV